LGANGETIRFRPLTPKTWSDLEDLFGPRGASGGCWCMWWRLKRSEYNKKKGAGNKRAFQKIVAAGASSGVLAYVGGKAVGWCAIAPRRDYPVLEQSRILKPVDDLPVWSVTCFFVPRLYRRQGLTSKLLVAAVELARKQGATAVEGYPQDPKDTSMVEAFAWTGFASAFKKAGFKEVARRSPTRPVMRKLC